MDNLTKGTRIYYTGDLQNMPSKGTITGVIEKGGKVIYQVKFDEERFEDDSKIALVFSYYFNPSPGRRYRLLSEVEAERKKTLESLQQKLNAERRNTNK